MDDLGNKYWGLFKLEENNINSSNEDNYLIGEPFKLEYINIDIAILDSQALVELETVFIIDNDGKQISSM